MNKIFCLLIFLVFPFFGWGQWADDFSDGDLVQNPAWEGDVDSFLVNSDLELQLNANSAGQSIIYSALNFPDSLRWSMYFNMDFNPSGSNQLRIYLQLNSTDFSTASGYFFEVGESLSDDHLSFYRLDNGSETLIAEAELGALGTQPADVQLVITRDKNGLWEIFTDYEVTNNQEFELSFTDDIHPSSDGTHLLLYCKYTISNSTDFYFDDFRVEELLPDTQGPSLLSLTTTNPTQICLSFNEALDQTLAETITNYSIQNYPGTITEASLTPSNKVALTLSEPLKSGVEYLAIVNNVTDEAGNQIGNENQLSFSITEQPFIGDLLINELLFDPKVNYQDYVELYNNSDKVLNLKGLVLSNIAKNNDTVRIQTDLIFQPRSYLCLTTDTEGTKELYLPPDTAVIVFQKIPSMNNSDGNMSIFFDDEDGDRVLLDGVFYDEDWHNALIDNIDGVSLERISFTAETNQATNWQSPSSLFNYGTPGYANSNRLNIMNDNEELINIPNKVFSPNDDGNEDFLVISLDTEKDGYFVDVDIFDQNGFLIKKLAQNQLLNAGGILRWDGENELGDKAKIGVYILSFDLFHPDGDTIRVKKTCVLADFLN